MSTAPPDAPPATTPPEGAIRCPRCGAQVPRGQDWCLECGLAARTRVAPAPRWRVPLIAAALVAALALAAMAAAFVDLTEDPPPPLPQTAPAPQAPPVTTPPATTAPPPATTAPSTTTQPPAATGATPGAGSGGAVAPESPPGGAAPAPEPR